MPRRKSPARLAWNVPAALASEVAPGIAVELAPGVRRLTAPNASPLTGRGTNTYLLGDPPRVVLDPGPAMPQHVEAILRETRGIDAILVTHTHADHSPAARLLAARTGARLIGRAPPRDGRQDESFVPAHEPRRDERFAVDGRTLRAIDTPGHASNHVCYLLEEPGLLFSGDHVLDGVTPVILAPDGDMSAYLDSLRRLEAYPLRAIAPGHGRVLDRPREVIAGVIAHRERREAKVLAALGKLGDASVEALIAHVYDDVRPELHRLARHTLEAHLAKLEREGRCERRGAGWAPTSRADRNRVMPRVSSPPQPRGMPEMHDLPGFAPWARGDVFVGSTVLGDRDDDHAGRGRILQYDANLAPKGGMWIDETTHLVGGLKFDRESRLWAFDSQAFVVLTIDRHGVVERRDFGRRAFSHANFARDGSILLGEHVAGSSVKPEIAARLHTRIPLMPGTDRMGDGHVWRFRPDGTLVKEYGTHTHGGIAGFLGVTMSALTPDESVLVYCSETGPRLMRYDLENDRQLPDLKSFADGEREMFFGMQFRADGRLVAMRGTRIDVLDDAGATLRSYPLEGFGWATLELSADDRHAYIGNFFSGELAKIDLATGAEVASVQTGMPKSLAGIAQYRGEPRVARVVAVRRGKPKTARKAKASKPSRKAKAVRRKAARRTKGKTARRAKRRVSRARSPSPSRRSTRPARRSRRRRARHR